MIHKIKSYKLSDYDLLGEGKVAETTDPLDLTDANEAMGKMCEKHGVVACEDRGGMGEGDHMHEVEEIEEINAEILSVYEDADADDDDADDADEKPGMPRIGFKGKPVTLDDETRKKFEKQMKALDFGDPKRAELERQIRQGTAPQRDEGMKMNEGLSRFEELAFGKMRPATQPGVETDSQVEESHGTLLRRRYYGRY